LTLAGPCARDLPAKSNAGVRRAAAIQDNLFALGLYEHSGILLPDQDQPGHAQIDAALTTARVFTLESKQLPLLTLYEQCINRSIQKNLAILQQVQTTCKAAHEAAALLKLSEMRDLECVPTKDGFDFRMTKSTPPSTENSASNAPPPPISPDSSPENPKHKPPAWSLNEIDFVLSAFIRFHPPLLRPLERWPPRMLP
jgi:hypothetical protein